MRILVADDNKANLLIAQTILERQGHIVSLARNGFDAIELVRTQTFDAALLDILMPDMDGVRTIRRIHAFSPDLTVFALTSYDSPADVNRYLQAGFDGLIAKPLKPGDFDRAMEMVSSGSPAILSRQSTDQALSTDIPLIDEDVFSQGIGRADATTARSILCNYRQTLSEAMKTLHASLPGALALDPVSLRSFRDSVHAIKSASAMIGLKRTPHLASRLRNAPPAELRSGVKLLLIAIQESLPALQSRLTDPIDPPTDGRATLFALRQAGPAMQVSRQDETEPAHHHQNHCAAI